MKNTIKHIATTLTLASALMAAGIANAGRPQPEPPTRILKPNNAGVSITKEADNRNKIRRSIKHNRAFSSAPKYSYPRKSKRPGVRSDYIKEAKTVDYRVTPSVKKRKPVGAIMPMLNPVTE